jgi:serine/threonine protein kinase
MGRKEGTLDPAAGPVEAFAFELRKLRYRAGTLTYRAMARKAHCSASALSAAAKGDALPSLPVTLLYVKACGGDEAELRQWQQRWWQVKTQIDTEQAASASPDDSPPPKLVIKPLSEDEPRLIGGFRLRGRIGTGAMGRVYLGETAGGRPVAVKVIRPELADDPQFRRRFAREIEAVRQVHGLYTAPLVDADPNAPQPWLATGYIAGPSLGDAVTAHGPLPTDAVYALALGVAEALTAIHAAGVIHRDLKPANVLLVDDGPRVIDFGIARAADASHLTKTGQRVGTPPFMSPEEALDQHVGPPADVFALGALLTYAATGKPPFGDGPSDTAVVHRIIYEPPNLTDLDEDLRQLVQACLHKDPHQRPTLAEIIERCRIHTGHTQPGSGWLPRPIAAEISQREDLMNILTDPAERRSPRRALTAAVLAVGIVAATATIPWVFSRTSPQTGPPPPLATGVLPGPTPVNPATPPASTSTPASSPPIAVFGSSQVNPEPSQIGPPIPLSPATATTSDFSAASPQPAGNAPAANPQSAGNALAASPQSASSALSSPSVQEQRVVELSTQPGNESVDIDWWRQMRDKSGDLQMDQNGIYTVMGAKLSVIGDSPEPTFARCAQVQAWTTRVNFATLHVGSRLCAQSRMGRYAMLQVRALPSSSASNGRFVFYGRTWELAP